MASESPTGLPTTDKAQSGAQSSERLRNVEPVPSEASERHHARCSVRFETQRVDFRSLRCTPFSTRSWAGQTLSYPAERLIEPRHCIEGAVAEL